MGNAGGRRSKEASGRFSRWKQYFEVRLGPSPACPAPPGAALAAEASSHRLPRRLTGDSQHFKWGGGVLYPAGLPQDTDHMH